VVIPVRIDEVLYSAPRKGSEPSRQARTEFIVPETPEPPAPAAGDEIVQLTLGRDGIWEVSRTVPPVENTNATSARSASPSLPRVARLYHAFLRLYSAEGGLQTMGQSRGLMIDLYA
jgi:hypothetical protein